MELFVLLSFVGTFMLITAQAVDYAVESMRRPIGTAWIAMPDNEVPTEDVPAPWKMTEQYDQAA